MRRAMLCLAASAVLLPVHAGAQSFTGTYTLQVPSGGVVTLVLKQDQTGNATGTLSGNGTVINITGKVSGTSLVGQATSQTGKAYFEAALEGDNVEVILADMNAQGQPDYQNARDLTFTRQGSAAAAPAPPAAPASGAGGNPLARGGGAGPGADPNLGTFLNEAMAFTVIRAPQGSGYAGNMQVQGQDYPFTAHAAAGGLAGSFNSGGQTYMFQATIAGNTMTLVSGGQTYTLQRRGSAQAPMAPGAPAAGAAPSANPMDQQLTQLLTSSNWCSFSYNQTSGRSNSSKGTFRPDGILVMSTNTEGGTVNQFGGSMGVNGSVYSQQQGGTQVQWRVQGGQLYLNGGQGFQLVPLQISRNSNGYPIITANGTEYSQCN